MMNFMQNLYNNKPSSSLPSNIIPNPKGKAKAITTRSGMFYKEPPIPPPGVEQQEPIEETTDTELPSPKDIQPPLVQVEVQLDKSTEEPCVVIPKAKANLTYPSRLQKEKLREKDDILAAKFMEIFRDLHFELSFADALVHIPKFALMFKMLLNNKDKLIELTKMPLNENYSAVVLKNFQRNWKLRLHTLNDTKMVLELADQTISKPTGVAENIFVKVGIFYFPANFVVLDFIADPRVPLILGRPFLSTAHPIINVYEREIIIRQNQQSLMIQCSDIPSVKKVEQINKIDFIYAGGIDFESEEIEDFLNDDSIPFGVEDSSFNMDEDILFLESLLRDEPIPPHPINLNQTKLSIEKTNHSLNTGYEHFNTNLVTNDVAESSTKNLIPIPNECMVVSENGSQSTEPVNENSSNFTIISNLLFDNDKINFDEINSQVESNSNESTSNHDTEKSDYLDEFYGPFIPIHILEEERTRREHTDYINRIEMLFTINPHPHNPKNDNTNVESFSSFSIPNQESKPRQDEIDVVSATNDVLPPSDDDSDEEVNAIDNFIQNSEHEYSESEDSDLDNPLLPLPPPEPPDKEFNFEKEISVVRNVIVKFECINEKVKFDVFNDENDVFMFVIFAKDFCLLFAESEDTIFDPGFSPVIEASLCWIFVRFPRSSHPLIASSLGMSISLDLYCLATVKALIDVFEGELTLRVGKEAITFNLDQTSRYSANYNDKTAKHIDVIDMACEEFSQEVLGFSDTISSGNPTPFYDPIVSTTSPTLTPFGNSDFLLEEVDAFPAVEDEPTLSEGDILLLEAFLNDDPSPPPYQGNYLPEVRKELKICEAHSEKSVDEPHVAELKELPP
nr:hypothetical protein [Tanacetum cinerariifolium]